MLKDFLTNQDSWLNQEGPSSDIIFSSRIRLARNFSDYPFPHRLSKFKKENILNRIQQVYKQVNCLRKSSFLRMEELDNLERQLLLERHLISLQHTSSPKGKGVIFSKDERIAVMINEEDHLRLQVISSGFDLKLCWHLLDELDNELGLRFEFAFMPDLGYLTSCPTNVGTGLRVSCMLRLPALVITKRINKILELLTKISFTVRGLFGEGTAAYGDFFQISNQVCLGLCEVELIENLAGVINQIKEQEVEARRTLLKKYKLSIEDSTHRALAILRNSRLINSKEALGHLSMLSLGLDLGIIKGIKRNVINNLFIISQPAHLQKIEDRPLKEQERDYIRAEIIRDKLKQEDFLKIRN
ncbi:MAG: protein arginine kinase [Candidatus Omnitrophota bacterium]|nr:MAG: protein arginine kinase [Candidatus Omnitrophota bacterium]